MCSMLIPVQNNNNNNNNNNNKNKRNWSFIWLGMAKDGCGQSGYETLKLNGSQEGAVGINWFFAWCYKFRRAKSCFNDFRVAVTF